MHSWFSCDSKGAGWRFRSLITSQDILASIFANLFDVGYESAEELIKPYGESSSAYAFAFGMSPLVGLMQGLLTSFKASKPFKLYSFRNLPG